jgi:hypothetical protein
MSDLERFMLRVLGAVSAVSDFDSAIMWQTKGKYAPISFFVDCSDVFVWGCADFEPLPENRIDAFEQAYADVEATGTDQRWYGGYLFCCRMRGQRPQGAAYPKDPRLWPLFDACGPEREPGFGNPRRHPAEVDGSTP